MMVDPHSGRRQRCDLIPGDEGATTGFGRAQLGDWLAVTSDDESRSK
jgi:hypothetical protein